jgi:hypothetical protein
MQRGLNLAFPNAKYKNIKTPRMGTLLNSNLMHSQWLGFSFQGIGQKIIITDCKGIGFKIFKILSKFFIGNRFFYHFFTLMSKYELNSIKSVK